MATADLFGLSQALDGFRNGGPTQINQVCQASDCNSAPFSVLVVDYVFLPPYYSMPTNGGLAFTATNNDDDHTATQGSAYGSCDAPSTPAFDFPFSAASNTTMTTSKKVFSKAGSYYFKCSYHCGFGMYGQVDVAKS